MTTDRTASRRFRLRVLEVMEQRNITQKSLRGSSSEGWISNKLHGRRGIQLDEAESIAAALDVPLPELLRRPDDHAYQLDNIESRLIEGYRSLTPDEQRACVTMVTLRQRPAPLTAGEMLAAKRAKPTTNQGAAHVGSAAHRSAAAETLPTYLQAIVEEFEERLARAFGERTGEQATAARAAGAPLPARDRKVRGSHPGKG